MNSKNQAVPLTTQSAKKKLLKDRIKKTVIAHHIDNERRLIKAIAAELKISVLDCAAALAILHTPPPCEEPAPPLAQINPFPQPITPAIRLVRYRLDLGHQHELNVTELKKVLVEESGVDIKNIANVRIQDSYTLIDLPDEMPQEIFHHLKSVEINGQKLDIRRVKSKNKKRNTRRYKHYKQATPNSLMN